MGTMTKPYLEAERLWAFFLVLKDTAFRILQLLEEQLKRKIKKTELMWNEIVTFTHVRIVDVQLDIIDLKLYQNPHISRC